MKNQAHTNLPTSRGTVAKDRLPWNPLWVGVRQILVATLLVSQLSRVMGFSVVVPNVVVTPSSLLVREATRAAAADDLVQPVQPKRFISEKQRMQALKNMDLQQMTKRVIDAQMLELLSDQFLYPTKQTQRQRPRGRPESVPGAMGFEALLKSRGEALASQQDPSTIMPYTTIAPPISPTTNSNRVEIAAGRKREGVRGSTSKLKKSETITTKKRKKVHKNLPEPKSHSEQQEGNSQLKLIKERHGRTEKSVDLQKYYRTELLTAKEEYALGMKVHFMMRCEDVHEGLAERLLRLPTIEEWAHACGFIDPDPTFVPAEGDAQIRPAGAEALFEERDPLMFVGNGLANEAGPGRGRGRVKREPSVALEPYYDDSDLKFPEAPPLPADNKKGQLVNTGTVTDFVETMFDGREAKQRMVQSNMRLVVSIARKYTNVGVNLQDLVQEGSLGLTRASEKFEPQKGFKFSTYASWWIQQAVFRSIAYHSRTIRLPVHVHNLLNRIRRVRMSLERNLGRAPTNDEMAEQLDMSTENYNKMIRLTRRSISLEVPKYQQNPKDLGHEGDDLLGDTISSSANVVDENTPEKRVDRSLFHQDLRDMLTVLEEDERRVICARYGLADGLTRTVTTVASQMKQSKSWVRSQECRALRKLRRPWYEKRLKEHQDALIN